MTRMRKTADDRTRPTPIEAARAAGLLRRSRAGLLCGTALTAAALLVLALPAQADPLPNARPTGGNVVAGQAAIVNTPGATTINQATNRAAIDWQSFSVGRQQTVQFNQPNAGSVTLNRVVGPDPSQIAGRINANGTIVISNGSGVYFAQGSQVNAHTLVATTAGISNQDFMAGRMAFSQPGRADAMVSNAGTITVAQSGLAALVAPAVANSGVINAPMGKVVLAGAQAHTVDLYGDGMMAIDVTRQVTQVPVGPDGRKVTALVTNTGTILAEGGSVVLTAQAVDGIVSNLVDARGVIRADTTAAGRTGSVVLRGVGGSLTIEGEVSAAGNAPGTRGGTIEATASTAVLVRGTARVNASGQAGGGTIALGTTVARAANTSAVPAATARFVGVERGATITASAVAKDSGGKVVVLSTERTEMAEHITARGAGRRAATAASSRSRA